VATRHLEGSDRETYFLGLAYGFGGRYNAAIGRLQKISQKSDFYSESLQLIQRWSKQ
jgi:hypothetical protein